MCKKDEMVTTKLIPMETCLCDLSSSSVKLYVRQKHFKASQLHSFCPYATVYCDIELKLNYLKNQNLLLIRVKNYLSL